MLTNIHACMHVTQKNTQDALVGGIIWLLVGQCIAYGFSDNNLIVTEWKHKTDSFFDFTNFIQQVRREMHVVCVYVHCQACALMYLCSNKMGVFMLVRTPMIVRTYMYVRVPKCVHCIPITRLRGSGNHYFQRYRG